MTSYEQRVNEVIFKIDQQVDDKTADKMLRAIVGEQESDVGDYPPLSSANRPPGNDGYSWYIRGFGTKTRTGRSYATSERFNLKWKPRRVSSRKHILENKASYGGYIMGDVQVAWAKGVGWEKTRDIVIVNGQKYRQLAAKVIERVNRS